MTNEILKLAKECDTTDSFDFVGDTILVEFCESFYRAAYNAGLEAAADAADKELEGDCSNATRDAVSDAIRALEKKP